jgi:hypothetical protein
MDDHQLRSPGLRSDIRPFQVRQFDDHREVRPIAPRFSGRGYAVSLLVLIQADLGRYREQLSSIHQHWLTEREREQLLVKPYRNPTLRGVSFLIALIGVVTIGFLLLEYALWRC